MTSMSLVKIIVLIAVVLLIVSLVSYLAHRRRPNLNTQKFSQKWRELQVLCGTQETWPLAIINADKLLDEALKKKHFKGKTMGERLVSAQRSLSSNDRTWRCHKLRNRLVHDENVILHRKDVETALRDARQALKDLGAL